MVNEFRRCKESYEYFVEHYIKIDDNSGNLKIIQLYPYQKRLLKLIHNNKFVICKFPRQPFALNTRLLTTTGWTTIGEVKRGDFVYDRKGKPVKVIGLSPVMEHNKCFKIVFDNGQEFICDENHMWFVSHSDWDHKEKILSTQQLADYTKKKRNHVHGSSLYVNIGKPLDFGDDKKLPIDPYLFGVWLGDGHSAGGRVTCHVNDYSHYENYINACGMNISNAKEYRPGVMTFQIEGLTALLSSNGLKNNKHIPEEYLRSSEKQRLLLLRGLMDTDGNHKKNGACEFYQKSKTLIEEFRFLLSSLAIKSRIREKIIKGETYYTVSFRPKEYVFLLDRKIPEYAPSHPKNNRFYIHSIEEIDSVSVKCIEVENQDSSFLVGDTLIPTHNCGKTTSMATYIVWCMIFRKRFKVGVAADKDDTATEIMDRIKTAYENLPYWMQQGVKKWDAHKVVLENGSRVDAAATTKKTFRGKTYNLVLLDEFAFVEQNIADPFYTSIYPVISKSDPTIPIELQTKLVIISTPNGMNHFHKLYTEASEGRSSFKPIEIKWDDVPGRDEKFKEETISNIGIDRWEQEYDGSFLGAPTSLIPAYKLKTLTWHEPFDAYEDMKFWKPPIKDHTYFISVDVCRGRGLDYHAMSVTDITTLPYEVVATYHNNTLDTMLYPSLILEMAKRYNEAFVLIELNDIGKQVSDILCYELEYENVLSTLMKGRSGQILTVETGNAMGVTMSKPVKATGCSNLKSLIMHDKLIFHDHLFISELTTFENVSGQYKAAQGAHDDMVMTLVTFAWAAAEPYFADLTDMNLRTHIFQKKIDQMEEDLVPIGFFPHSDPDDDGISF